MDSFYGGRPGRGINSIEMTEGLNLKIEYSNPDGEQIIPTGLEQVQNDVTEALNEATIMSANPPYAENGRWMQYSYGAKKYIDSGKTIGSFLKINQKVTPLSYGEKPTITEEINELTGEYVYTFAIPEGAPGNVQNAMSQEAYDPIPTGQDSHPVKEAGGIPNYVKARIEEINIPDTSAIETNISAIQEDISTIQGDIQEAKEIALGRSAGYVFQTKSALDTWLTNEDNKGKLKQGDNLYIIDKNVPDYWWDGTQIQELETQKVDLSEYATNSSLDNYLLKTDISDWAKASTKPEYYAEDFNWLKAYVDTEIDERIMEALRGDY